VKFARVALDVPLEDAFDFRIPEGLEIATGSLVIVPFGRARKVGVVIEEMDESAVPAAKLRAIEAVVADVPPIASPELDLYQFCARYYQRPLGEVLGTVLPPRLRQVSRRPLPAPSGAPAGGRFVETVSLPDEQDAALAACAGGAQGFRCVLVQGVTGSGKTEVYLRLIAGALADGRQALMLVPRSASRRSSSSTCASDFPRRASWRPTATSTRASAPRPGSPRRPAPPTSCSARGSRC
jgi:Primosomal protein N'' (replication factor Y) - superfamily II helicase